VPKPGRDRAPWRTAAYLAAVRALKANPDTPCVWCGAIATTIDHAIPVALGGGDGDLVPSCWPCNAKRGSKLGHAIKRARRAAAVGASATIANASVVASGTVAPSMSHKSRLNGRGFLDTNTQDPPAFRQTLPGTDPPPSRVW